MSLHDNPIPLAFFADLIGKLRSVKPRRKGESAASPSREGQYLEAWLHELRRAYSPLPPGTATIFFRLLFPGEGVRRRYNMQEGSLCIRLSKYFNIRKGGFNWWNRTTLDQRGGTTGCLGAEVQKWLEGSNRVVPARDGGLTIGEVDALLDELASFCSYSAPGVYRGSPSRSSHDPDVDAVLKRLLDPLTAPEIAIIIQIILRDLSPLLYPLPTLSGTQALQDYNAMPYSEITLRDAMAAWHPKVPLLYGLTADLDVVMAETENLEWEAGVYKRRPLIGTPAQVPKSIRPSTCSRATAGLKGDVSIETKYDGERLQVHIDTNLPYDKQIKIFSKSGRDSTDDRSRLHPVIRASLGLPLSFGDAFCEPLLANRLGNRGSSCPQTSHSRFIVEGEMVSFNEDENRIDEFWTLASVKHGGTPTSRGGEVELFLTEPYRERRQRLQAIVRPILGYSMMAEAVVVNFDDRASALEDLRLQFARVIANRGVPPSIFTTFYIGLEAPELQAYTGRDKKHYHILFSTSYGLDRTQLDSFCHKIRESNPAQFSCGADAVPTTFRSIVGTSHLPTFESPCTTFTFTLADHLASKALAPTFIFQTPLVGELTGAGFQQTNGSPFYELRWPRLTKTSRTDGSPLTLRSLQLKALAAMQPNFVSAQDEMASIWGAPTDGSSGAETPEAKLLPEVVRGVERHRWPFDAE
ncbi:hypothetical protein RQP46_008558 [Phenoliferia psychrophenolica]